MVSEKALGYPYSKVTAEYKMKKILAKTGISKTLSPHSLRHTHTSLLAEAGVGLTEIMERLGHEDDGITKKVYLHVTRTKRLDAANKFSELMKNAKAVNPRSQLKVVT
jgi:integrase